MTSRAPRDGVGASAGHRIIPGPTPINDCFWTDDRGFSNDFNASARCTHWVQVDTDTHQVQSNCYSGMSHECDCEDGDIEGSKEATPRWQTSQIVSGGSGVYHVDIVAAVNNPLFTGSPDADLNGRVSIDTNTRTVGFSGMVDAFPSYEAYCSVDGSAAQTLFTLDPAGGPGNLAGGANRHVQGHVQY